MTVVEELNKSWLDIMLGQKSVLMQSQLDKIFALLVLYGDYDSIIEEKHKLSMLTYIAMLCETNQEMKNAIEELLFYHELFKVNCGPTSSND